ncbi:uncharacterized protein LOC119686012 [Teleopsis dalmanni]|uniref:uncharacterized protein LOC119686012 n=1 Tax=Teleopsis dalmanni TaxID=139649 RepID=UPI0018CE19FF|nr:uncharacterized protein LOC119686012 [Teleopsis dalmanni]
MSVPLRLGTSLASNELLKKIPNVSPMIHRCFNYRKDCGKFREPKCHPKTLKESKCAKDKAKREALAKKDALGFPYYHLIYNPICCNEICPEPFPRFDDLYYVESDKLKRKYPRTWKECLNYPEKRRPVCDWRKAKAIPYDKRVRKPHGEPCDCGIVIEKAEKCKKIVSKGCKPVKDPPSCALARKPTDCKKICTQYPSFSECQKPPFKKARIVECDCLKSQSLCTLFRLLKNKKKYKNRVTVQ